MTKVSKHCLPSILAADQIRYSFIISRDNLNIIDANPQLWMENRFITMGQKQNSRMIGNISFLGFKTLIDYILKRHKITGENYINLLKRLRDAIKAKHKLALFTKSRSVWLPPVAQFEEEKNLAGVNSNDENEVIRAGYLFHRDRSSAATLEETGGILVESPS